jgi:hypothetical protein
MPVGRLRESRERIGTPAAKPKAVPRPTLTGHQLHFVGVRSCERQQRMVPKLARGKPLEIEIRDSLSLN